MFGIGSILQKLLLPKSALFKQCLQKWQPELSIFGSGFIQDFDPQQYRITRHLKPIAVRGKLTLNLLQKLVPTPENIITGDAGIFASRLLHKLPEKQYTIGIVPHYTESTHPSVLALKEKIPHALFINVLDPPLQVLQQIAQCETILSSSLHGLIVADSLLIPNKHMLISDSVIGQGFKFQDYYSNYDLQDDFLSAQSLEYMDDLPAVIACAYRVQPLQVEEMQNRLKMANTLSH